MEITEQIDSKLVSQAIYRFKDLINIETRIDRSSWCSHFRDLQSNLTFTSDDFVVNVDISDKQIDITCNKNFRNKFRFWKCWEIKIQGQPDSKLVDMTFIYDDNEFKLLPLMEKTFPIFYELIKEKGWI